MSFPIRLTAFGHSCGSRIVALIYPMTTAHVRHPNRHNVVALFTY